jgi:hypothetical protein
MFMLETIINGPPHYSLCGESKESALETASMQLWMWVRFTFKDRCDPEAAKKVMALKDQRQYADAIDVWNAANSKPRIALHEVEILARDCHHDLDTLAREDDYYAVEPALDGIEGQVSLLDTNCAALEHAGRFLRDWTSRNPLNAYECEEPTRQRVRKLLRKKQVADAIDAWTSGVKTPTIAIHKIRILKKECHHDEPGDNSSSRRP